MKQLVSPGAMRVLSLLLFVTVFSFSVRSQGIYQFWGTSADGGKDDIGVIFSTDTTGGSLTGRHAFNYLNKAAYGREYGLTAFNDKLYGIVSTDLSGISRSLIIEYDPYTAKYTDKLLLTDANGLGGQGSFTVYNGQLYGVVGVNSNFSHGQIFRYDPAGNVFTKLYDFDGTTADGPIGKMVVFNNKLYGMTLMGSLAGTLFEFDPATNTFTKKIEFNATDGAFPIGSLVVYNNKIYGTTLFGGTTNAGMPNGGGVLFEYDPATNIFTKKFDFLLANGSNPSAGLTVYDNKLWGITTGGGANNVGVIFQYDPSTNTYTKKKDMVTATGASSRCDLLLAGNKMFGVASQGGFYNNGTLFEYDPAGNTYTTRKDFKGTDGNTPIASLVSLNDTIYGTTYIGGSQDNGVLFAYDRFNFSYKKQVDFHDNKGSLPSSSLIYFNKNLYGLTYRGGPRGTGVLYKYDLSNNKAVAEIEFDTLNGREPMGDLAEYAGKLYGMCSLGGANQKGVLFNYDPTAKIYTKLLDFDDQKGGFNVYLLSTNSLVLYNNKFYGVTQSYGANNAGTLFEYDPASNVFTRKIDFVPATGKEPSGRLLPLNGKLYGVTLYGGANNEGVLFEYDPVNNIYTKKLDFQSPGSFSGYGQLVAYNNKIYGVANRLSGSNMLFEYDPATNNYTNKFTFTNATGREPFGGLLLKNNLLYGVTLSGGAHDKGTIFEYNPATNNVVKKADFDSTNTGTGGNTSYLISIPAGVANGNLGTCTPRPPFNIDNTNNLTWVAVTDGTGDAIAEIYPNGNNLGTVDASVYVQGNPVRNAGGLNYLNRSITITVQNQPDPGQSVTLRLYIKKSELDDLINTPGSGISSVNDLVVYKNENTCGTAIGTNVVKLNTTASEWGVNYVLTVQVTSFSSFHFSNVNTPLPSALLSFTASRKNKLENQLDWQTTSESNSQSFVIERSTDGSSFNAVGTVAAAGTSSTIKKYQFTDTYTGKEGTLFYRLKMVDKDSRFKYSKVVKLVIQDMQHIVVVPNPVKDKFVIKSGIAFSEVQVIDANGKVVRRLTPNTANEYNISGLGQGVYVLRAVSNKEVVVTRFVKL